MVGILGNGGVYWTCGVNIRWRCSTISEWIGGGVVELYIYPRTTSSARQSTSCGGRVVMAGRVGYTYRYELDTTWMERMVEDGLYWMLPIRFAAFT